MAGNKSKIDKLHDRMPKAFHTKTNVNWRGVIEALGQGDQQTADLIEAVRQQFFVKTANRPFLDRLGANVKVSRPAFVGMDDPTFRKYIPILAWQPKQVKLIIDSLLNIFYFRESTTAFVTSSQTGPFDIEDGWDIQYTVDGIRPERVEFKADDFTSISAATPDEIVATWNRQAKYSFAIIFTDSITKLTSIRLFTNTIGSKGSIEITGGHANVVFQFEGFIDDAGNGADTEWTITKVGDLVTYAFTGGTDPDLNVLQDGDIILSDLTDNVGSFVIEEVDLANSKLSFRNLFGTVGVSTQTSDRDVKFIRPLKAVIYVNEKRAVTWEVNQGEIVVEMPTSPPVVKRRLEGASHHNVTQGTMTSRVSNTELVLADASEWPSTGIFLLQRKLEIQTRILTPTEDTTLTKQFDTRTCLPFTSDATMKYTYTGKTGNNLTGISPALSPSSSLNSFTLSSLTRASNVFTGVTSTDHNYVVGENVIISGTSGIPVLSTTGDITISTNTITSVVSVVGVDIGYEITGPGIPALTLVTDITGVGPWIVEISNNATATAGGAAIDFLEPVNSSFEIVSVPSSTSFTFNKFGPDGSSASPGTTRVERIGVAEAGSILTLTTAQLNTDMVGPYIFDLNAAFVLSSFTTDLQEDIKAGNISRTIAVDANDILNEPGSLIFDFGTERQEGPVSYSFKPSNTTIAIDPAYVFEFNHDIGSAVTMIRRKGPHAISNTGKEFAPYITDPTAAREVLQELILDVKSVGIFVEFLVRFPEQLYATIDVYRSGVDPG